MKFMKLGSKPDTFQANGSSIRYVLSDLASDVTVAIDDVKFYLHKFPLLSKSTYLQKLILKANEDNSDEIQLIDFPGGPKAFEICAKFCYGMIVTLNAYNVVAARCAAEFLEMTEEVDKGNLIFKIEVFLNTSIFRSWKDSIIVLQTTNSLSPWPENLKIIGKCVDSIASKTSVDPSQVTWSYTHNRKLAVSDKIVEHGITDSVHKDWWVEDICELEIELFKRVMIAIKSKGRMDSSVIGEALRTYSIRWLPDSVDALISGDHIERHRFMLETVISLLPSGKATGCSCSFLLKLLKAASLVEVDDSVREELVKRVSLKLDEASARDLLIPAKPPQATIYDVELVQQIVKRFTMQDKYGWNVDMVERGENGTGDGVSVHGSWLSAGRLVDAYLAEVAHDPRLEISCFVNMALLIPDMARPAHDGLYRAIDIYLKEHPGLSKSDKKKLCGLMDPKKFTISASTHAAQNERLPLRMVVQVLYFEQMRSSAATTGAAHTTPSLDLSNSTTSADEDWDSTHHHHHHHLPPAGKASLQNSKSLRKQMDMVKLEEDEGGFQKKITKKGSKNSRSGVQLLPSRSRRIFDKLWVMGKGLTESKSSETSGSSQSPTSVAPGETKSFGSSGSRHRRHSIS